MGEDGRALRHLPPRRRGAGLTVLGADALAELPTRPLGVYIHVPFCASRCGYCDFVTFTAGELGGTKLQASYADAAIAEIRLAAATLGPDRPAVSTVFFGGGTPTLLPPGDLVRILDAVRDVLGVATDVEVTVEANPDSIDPPALDVLRAGGFTRISFGMQSVRRHVLAVLDRTHTPGRAQAAVAEAHAAGFVHCNLDLIFGTPGETDDDWRATLDAAIGAGPDHIAAYALTIEPRTRLAARIRHGDTPPTDDDVLAARYELADEVLTAAGFHWYEVSNWALDASARCAHNQLYWRNHHWWGVGPGAHSHVGGTRWWNVRNPSAYAALVDAGTLPVDGWEQADADQRALEDLLLGVRTVDGVAIEDLASPAGASIPQLRADGLVEPEALAGGRIILTRRGRLLTDSVIRTLVADGPRG